MCGLQTVSRRWLYSMSLYPTHSSQPELVSALSWLVKTLECSFLFFPPPAAVSKSDKCSTNTHQLSVVYMQNLMLPTPDHFACFSLFKWNKTFCLFSFFFYRVTSKMSTKIRSQLYLKTSKQISQHCLCVCCVICSLYVGKWALTRGNWISVTPPGRCVTRPFETVLFSTCVWQAAVHTCLSQFFTFCSDPTPVHANLIACLPLLQCCN